MTTLHPPTHTGTERAQRLGPLLAAIGRELRERTEALGRLLVERERLEHEERAVARLDAECAAHRSELRHAHQELARLGCRLVSLHPTVFSVGTGGLPERSLFWCTE